MPYHRLEGSYDPRASFIFEGIGKDEVIGGFGLKQGGAGGVEIDRADYSLGTPPHALVLATCTGFSDEYQVSRPEDAPSFRAPLGGTQSPLVRADMVYFETPKSGGVFSVGSIAWCGSLSHNNYSNNVSRIMKNVLGRFSSDTELP
jgi:N,N-dimethylformamidase